MSPFTDKEQKDINGLKARAEFLTHMVNEYEEKCGGGPRAEEVDTDRAIIEFLISKIHSTIFYKTKIAKQRNKLGVKDA